MHVPGNAPGTQKEKAAEAAFSIPAGGPGSELPADPHPERARLRHHAATASAPQRTIPTMDHTINKVSHSCLMGPLGGDNRSTGGRTNIWLDSSGLSL